MRKSPSNTVSTSSLFEANLLTDTVSLIYDIPAEKISLLSTDGVKMMMTKARMQSVILIFDDVKLQQEQRRSRCWVEVR
jgi:hypothetical protein